MKTRALLFAIGLGLSGVLLLFKLPGAAQITTTPALVRIDLTGADDLARIDALNIPVYAHLTTANVDYLLAVLTPDQREQVAALGFSPTTLDPTAAGATYYLIETDGRQIMQTTTAAFTILHDDGRHT